VIRIVSYAVLYAYNNNDKVGEYYTGGKDLSFLQELHKIIWICTVGWPDDADLDI
jgi:hypothetical protein